MIELREHNGYNDVVYIDGEILPHQLIEPPTFENGLVSVRCFTDKRMQHPLDPNTVKYQALPFNTASRNEGDVEITTFYFKNPKA